MGFGPARAVAAVANVLAGAFPLCWVGSPAQQFVALSPGRPIAPAWTSSTTIWFPAPASVSPTQAHTSFGPSPLENASQSGCVGLGQEDFWNPFYFVAIFSKIVAFSNIQLEYTLVYVWIFTFDYN